MRLACARRSVLGFWYARPSGLAVALALLVLAFAVPLAAQTRPASIEGRAVDESGAALPGVSVVASSPALQVGRLTQISGADGSYRFTELPIGAYRITFELPGFRSFVRDGVALTAGFVARIDVTLAVGTLEESVTVSGASPVVDSVSTRGGSTLSNDVIESIPNSRNYQDLLNMTPGVAVTAPPQMGEVGFRALVGNIKTYGLIGQSQTQVEGLQMSESAFPDFATAEQVDIRTYGNTADVAQPGAVTDLIVKSGGNSFRGRAHEQFMHKSLQSTNIDDRLRGQGIRTGDAIRYYQDFAADLGGRIVRDKLWFYGALRDVRNERSLSGYAKGAGADGVYGTTDDEAGLPTANQSNFTGKVSYQPSTAHRIIGFWQRNWVVEPQAQASRFVPYEATREVQWEPIQYKAEWQAAPSSRFFASLGYGRTSEEIFYIATSPDTTSRYDRRTGIATGAFASTAGSGVDDIYGSISKRHTITGSATSYGVRFLGGEHELKLGVRAWLENRRSQYDDKSSGNYRLVYDNGVAAQINTWNYPVEASDRLDEYAAYVMDQWRLGRGVTVNLGLRWERNHAYVPEQQKAQGTFLGAGTFAKLDVLKWNALAPRAAVAWDMTGTGRSVLKGTYGWFNHRITASGFVSVFNPVRPQSATYIWRDTDRNNDYTPGEVNLALNGADFVSITGATSNIVNPDLKQPHTHELTSSLEHDLGRESSLRLLYVYKRATNLWEQVNVRRPYSAYFPLTRRDPGPDGALNTGDDAGRVTLYDFDPAFRGANFVGLQYVTRDNVDSYHTIEATYTKRPSTRWNMVTALAFTKNARYIDAIAENPNEDYFPIDRTWEWTYKLAGGYSVPRIGMDVSALYDVFSGLPGQRTYLFGTADPDGGAALSSINTVTLRLEEFGARRGPVRHKLDLRLSKVVGIGGTRRFRVDLDALNAINTNVAWGRGDVLGGTGIDWRSGPTFDYVTQIVAPRILRLGVSFEF